MADSHTKADQPISSSDDQLVPIVDRYVSALQAGDLDACNQLLRDHAELRLFVECLNDLDSLAPQTPPQEQDRDGTDVETVGIHEGSRQADRSQTLAQQEMDFGKYELLEEIGRGGMGVVYKARQKDLDRVVALKMILASQFASDEEIRRFYVEAKAAGSLKHSHIIGIHEVGQLRGQHYFAMDCVDGGSLADRLRRGTPDSETAAQCLSKVARAVDYLHAHNIVHRDLKPSNILLDDNGEPYVTDFGLAKVFQPDSRKTATGTIVGTPGYMAPEQAASRSADISTRTDVYSLGAILYEMLTGRPPFKADSPLDTLVQTLESEPMLPSRLASAVPRELELICLKCIEKDPRDRYGSAAELAEDLDRYLKDEPIMARPSGFVQLLRRWARRQPALASRLSGLAVVASIVQANYMVNGVDFVFHAKVMSVFGIWAVLAFACQHFLNRDRFAEVTPFVWSGGDVVLLTILLLLSLTDGAIGPLLIGYPLLVAASGLFFRVRLVWFTTCVSLLSYAVLIPYGHAELLRPHYPIVFGGALAVLGFIVAYQVQRVRVLSRYYESRRVP